MEPREMDRQETKGWIGEEKKGTISHPFQRRRIIKHFPLGKPGECKHKLAAHTYAVNKAKRMHGTH